MGLQQALEQFEFNSSGKGFLRIDPELNRWIRSTGLRQGVLHLSALHTSCSLTINENADPRVLDDLAAWMEAVVPQVAHGALDGSDSLRRYRHDDEGPDDMPAHIRTALTTTSLQLSFERGRLLLGTWQAVYLWEHRRLGSQRRLSLHLIGA